MKKERTGRWPVSLVRPRASPIIHAYSAHTGKPLAQFKGHSGPITALAVRNKALVSTSTDTTALVWDLSALPQEQPATKALDEAQAQACWHDLASADARKAHAAIRTLSAAPQQAVSLLRQPVKPSPHRTPRRFRG